MALSYRAKHRFAIKSNNCNFKFSHPTNFIICAHTKHYLWMFKPAYHPKQEATKKTSIDVGLTDHSTCVQWKPVENKIDELSFHFINEHTEWNIAQK